MRFSNPLPSAREYGRLSGSAQTRRSRAAAGTAKDVAAAIASPTATAPSRLRKREDIEHAPFGRARLEVGHDVREAGGRGLVARVDIACDHRSGPAAHA